MLKFLPFVRKNVFRNARRTILTVLSVTASLFLLGVLFSVYTAFFHAEAPPGQALRLITRHKVSLTQMLPDYYERRIREIPGVAAVAPQNWFGGKYIDNRPEHMFARFSADPETIFQVYDEFSVPPDQLAAFQADRQGVAIGREVHDRLGLDIGDRITIEGDIYPLDLELNVRAIFDGSTSTNLAYFHDDYLDEGLPEQWADLTGFFGIRAESAEAAPRVAKAIDEMFRNAPEPTKSESEAAFQLAFINQLGNVKLFLLSIAGAIVFTIMLVSANTVAMSVRERIREVGVLKTLGFTSTGVLALILAEALVISLIGGVLGVALAMAATKGLQEMTAGAFGPLAMPLWGVPVCLGAALVIGLCSSIVPAVSASHSRITEALRHTG